MYRAIVFYALASLRRASCILAALSMMFFLPQIEAKGETVFNVRDFGARGDGTSIDTVAIQKAIDACHTAQSGTVLFPQGNYRSGTVLLKSNIRIHLDEGARWLGSTNGSDYPRRPNGEFVYGTSSTSIFIHGVDVENVVIDGPGVIDGAKAGFIDPVTGQWQRGPMGILFEHSKNILLRDVIVTQIPGWAVNFFECENVEVRKIHVLNVMADGINPVACQHVKYDSVEIDGTGDDPITIKNEGPVRGAMLTSDIVITNCTVRNTKHPAVKIGTGTAGVFRDILVRDCEFEVSGTVFAIQLMRPSKEKERMIENVELSRITVKRARQLFDISTIGVERPVIRNLKINDISYAGDSRSGQLSTIWGTERAPIENLTISNLHVTDNVKSTWLSLAHVKGAWLNHFEVNLPRAKAALTVADCKDIHCTDWKIEGMTVAGPLMKLTNVDGFCLADSTSPAVTNFLFASGGGSRNITFSNFNASAATIPVIADATVSANGLVGSVDTVQIKDLRGPKTVAPNEKINVSFTVRAAKHTGPYRLKAKEGNRNAGGQWIWVEAEKSQEVVFSLEPLYQAGHHKIKVGNLSFDVEVLKSPAVFAYGEFAQIVSPATNGGMTRVKVTVKNIGSTAGEHVAELRADDRVVASKRLYLKPGEERAVVLQHRFDASAPRELKLGDFPSWRFFTAANVNANYFWGHHKLVIEAGGEPSRYDQYAAIYARQVTGDFDAVAHVLSQSSTTGNNSAVGMIIRNNLDDFKSAGFTTHLRVPMFGGYKIWYLDLNNDGVLETRSDQGDSSMPNWYKFEKRGHQFRAYCSTDRHEWKPCGKWFTIDSAQTSQDVGIFGNASSGLGEKSRVEFSDFEIIPVPEKN